MLCTTNSLFIKEEWNSNQCQHGEKGQAENLVFALKIPIEANNTMNIIGKNVYKSPVKENVNASKMLSNNPKRIRVGLLLK